MGIAKRHDGDDFNSTCAGLVERHLTNRGIAVSTASAITLEIFSELRSHFGGQTLYFPCGRVDASERAAEIHHQWQQGKTTREMAAEYGVTEYWVWRLLARERTRLQQIRQAVERAHPSKHSRNSSP